MSMDASDPVEELRGLLSEQRLEDRFHSALRSAFRRICDAGYYPACDLPDEVDARGGVAFAKEWLRDERADITLGALENRIDLSVQWLVERLPYRSLFDSGDHKLANEQLATLFRDNFFALRKWERKVPESEIEQARESLRNLELDSHYSEQDLRLLQRRRSLKYAALPLEEKAQSLERELERGYPFTCSHELVAFILRASNESLVSTPLVHREVEDLNSNLVGMFSPVIEVLRPVLDLSEQKVTAVADLTQSSSEEAAQILAYRAALVCRRLNWWIKFVAEAYLSGEPEFPSSIPGALFAYFKPEDAALLRAAVVLGRLLPCSGLQQWFQVMSFADIPANTALTFIDFTRPAERLVPDDFHESDADIEAVVRFALHSSAGPVPVPTQKPSALLAGYGYLPNIGAVSEPEEFPLNIERILAYLGPNRTAESARRVRLRPGVFYDRLCAEARMQLLGAEYLLMDNSHPVPSHAILAIACAFELQLKNALSRFAREHQEKFTLQEQPLDTFAKLIKSRDEFVTRALDYHHLDSTDLLAAINKVKHVRNRAAHEGALSLAIVLQYRDDWVDKAKGIFRPFFPDESAPLVPPL